MSRYTLMATALLVVGSQNVSAPSPLRITIDCGSKDQAPSTARRILDLRHENFDVKTFCRLIHDVIPKAVKDGRFVIIEDRDQSAFEDAQIPFSIKPPTGFIPKFALPRNRVNVPNIYVPPLRRLNKDFGPPRLSPKVKTHIASLRTAAEEETSAERMEKFKKGLQKMLHVVKVLGQIDQYLSERTRIIVEKVSKTFIE